MSDVALLPAPATGSGPREQRPGAPAAPVPGQAAGPRAPRRVTFRDVFAVGEFRTVFTALIASMIGDQIAAVAVTVLLYQRTGSALISGLGYATVFVPWLLGGPVLAALAERLPSRRVLVGCDLFRALLIGCAALPGLPVWGIGLFVLSAALLAPPFEASISALLPRVLDEDLYPVGNSLWHTVHQGAQLAGFAAGGAVVVLISPRGGLLLDSVTFALSALLLRRGLRHREPLLDEAAGPAGPGRLLREIGAGVAVVVGDRRLSRPLLLAVIGVAFLVVPEALAAPYAASLGAGPVAVGLIMAAGAGGGMIAALGQARLFSQATRERLMWPLAAASALPLIVFLAGPPLPVALGLLFVSGLCSTYTVTANARFALACPAPVRTRAFAVAMAGLVAAQTAAVVLAGAAATVFAPATVIAAAGLAGLLALLPLARGR